ncbi:MAG: DNA topoisomerase III [Clostridiales bacterium]|jgi:DNA topoisomerase-3|nr:DNA topoisomerase III [Clostridiales bacterium]
MKTIVLAEKPSVGKDIARVLGCRKQGNGYMEGDNYIVTWALGHLVTLADPEKYDQKYKTWELNDLPIMPEKLELVVIAQTSKQYGTVKEQLMRKDVAQIVIATDAGREGELVARWILEKAHCKKPVKRLWISSVTDKAIKEGFAKLKDGKEYVNLYHSAQARAEADWLVGINATRCLTTKYNGQLSCGRVQTPTVGLIVGREEEIRKFKPVPFYGIGALSGSMKLTWQDQKTNETRTYDKEKCARLFESFNGKKDGVIVQLSKTLKKQLPPQLYDLTELQRDANKRFGFSPKETLDVMQSLYEKHKLLTYPRTDSRYLSADIVPTLAERLRACGVGAYAQFAKTVLAKKITGSPNFVDDKKVSDHHAIIPTEQQALLGQLNEKELKVYDLVVRRFLAVLYPPFEYEQTSMKVKIGSEFFIARGQVILSQGFKATQSRADAMDDLDQDAESDVRMQTLPKMTQGDKLPVTQLKMTEGKTTPPPLFNEATLLSAMENPAKFVRSMDKESAKTLGETGGLGTVATRADIIEKLFASFMIEKRGKDICSTSKGRQLLNLVPPDLKSPELTAHWEQMLSKIAKGALNKSEFLGGIRKYTKECILSIKQSTEVYRHDNITGTKCPDCGKYMLEVNGKKGKMLICQDRECGYRQNVSFISNSRCPTCHKRMEIWGEGEKKIFVCVCGFKEKYDTYIDKNKNDMNKMNKRQVDQYMTQLKQDAKKDINPAMANAFAGLKLKK